MILEFTKEELIEQPEEHQLNMSRKVIVFKIKESQKTNGLNSGSKFIYEDETYEIMNRERVESRESYLKFNCLRQIHD